MENQHKALHSGFPHIQAHTEHIYTLLLLRLEKCILKCLVIHPGVEFEYMSAIHSFYFPYLYSIIFQQWIGII